MSIIIEFPETAQTEWKIVAEAAFAAEAFKARLDEESRVEMALSKLRVSHLAKQMLQAELDADQTPALEMMTLDDYLTNPTTNGPSDLIEGMLKDNGLMIVLGPSGSGKSTLAFQTAYSLLTGDDFLGQPVQKITGSVGILSYDMDGSMTMDWVAGYPGVDPRKVSVVNAYKRGNPIGVPAMRQKIAAAWNRMQVDYVIVDSFSASFFGNDQNDAAATMAHYRDLIKFALTECGARALCVLVHASESNPNSARGSTVHHDVADSIVSVSMIDPQDPMSPRKVRMVKYRAARGQHQMSPVVVGEPDSTTHLVSLDTGAMTLAGMKLPPSAAALAFPEVHEAPDTTVNTEEDEDL